MPKASFGIPCPMFRPPAKRLGYGAYCAQCQFSRHAHEMWARWTAEATSRRAAV